MKLGKIRPTRVAFVAAFCMSAIVTALAIRLEHGINTAVLSISLTAASIPALLIPLVQLRNELSILARTPKIQVGLLPHTASRKDLIETLPELPHRLLFEFSIYFREIIFNLAVQNLGNAAVEAPIIRIGIYDNNGYVFASDIEPDRADLFKREAEMFVAENRGGYLMAKDIILYKFRMYRREGIYQIRVQVAGANLDGPNNFVLFLECIDNRPKR